MREVDPDGRIVVHHRTVDTLGKMLRSGTITQEMRDAARTFQANFAMASLDPIRATPTLRMPGIGREPDLNDRQLEARRVGCTRRCRRSEGSTARLGRVYGM